MSARYYLPMRHDVIARAVFEELIKVDNPEVKIRFESDVEYIHTEGEKEYWWNIPIKTSTKVKHNRPDMIIWNHREKESIIIEYSCPADVNVSKKVLEKENIYGPLIRNMQLLYPKFQFTFVPIIIGALGCIPNSLHNSRSQLWILVKTNAKQLIKKLQILAISGTVKICKTFLNFRKK